MDQPVNKTTVPQRLLSNYELPYQNQLFCGTGNILNLIHLPVRPNILYIVWSMPLAPAQYRCANFRITFTRFLQLSNISGSPSTTGSLSITNMVVHWTAAVPVSSRKTCWNTCKGSKKQEIYRRLQNTRINLFKRRTNTKPTVTWTS